MTGSSTAMRGGRLTFPFSLDDAQKLDDVRDALRNGDLKKAAQHACVYTLTRVAL